MGSGYIFPTVLLVCDTEGYIFKMKGWPTWITLATLSFVRMLLGSAEPKNSTIQVVRVGTATRPFWISCLICHESAIAPTDRATPRCLQRPPQNKPTLIQSSNVMQCTRRISEYLPRDNARLWYMSKRLQASCLGCIGFSVHSAVVTRPSKRLF